MTRQKTVHCAFLALSALLAYLPDAVSQDTMVWSNIDCEQSHLKAPSGLRCRATQEYSGGHAANSNAGVGGIFRRWATFGEVNGVRLYYFLGEASGLRSFWRDTGTLESLIRGVSTEGKEATHFSDLKRAADADYVLFTWRGATPCFGIHMNGPSMSLGFRWQLVATRCAFGAAAATEGDVARFAMETGYQQR